MSSTEQIPIRDLTSQSEAVIPEGYLVDEPSQGLDHLLPYLRAWWNNRFLLLKAAFVSLIGAIIIAFLIPTRYQAVTRLMPPGGETGTLGMLAAMSGKTSSSMLSGLANDLLGGQNSGALFVGILGSRTVQDSLIDKFQLRRIYHDSKIEDARSDLAKHTDISQDRKSGIISIAVTDHDPTRAAEMAQTYVEELDRLVAQVSTSSARRERIFLEGRLKAVRADLDAASKRFSDFASKNTAIDIPTQGKAMLEAAATLQGQLIAAQSELEGLKQIYTDTNVRVRAAEARVSELNKKLNEIGRGDDQNNSDKEHPLYPSIRELPILGVTYADLYRQTKIEETVYELLTQQYELAKIEEAKEIPSVEVLDAAVVPTKKSFPPRTVIIILGMIAGLMFAMLWIVGKVRWGSIDDNDPWKEFVNEIVNSSDGIVSFIRLRVLNKRNLGRFPYKLFHAKSEGQDRISK